MTSAARIRVRSLLAAIRVREKKQEKRTIRPASIEKVTFTKEMRKDYTILCPQMSPVHFELLEPAFRAAGYNIDVLPNDNKQAVDMGLKYVNNDACYPSLIVVGQIMDALLSGKYDLNHTAVIITQTGGGCRASNYIGFIRPTRSSARRCHRSTLNFWSQHSVLPEKSMQTFFHFSCMAMTGFDKMRSACCKLLCCGKIVMFTFV